MVGWKFTKFLMSYLKLQVSFSLNFALLFSFMRDFCSVLLSETLYDLDKRNPNCSHEISQNLYLHRLFQVKKSIEELCFMTLKSDAKFEEKLTCGLENDTRNIVNFHQSTWKSHNWDFDGILYPEVENLWAQNSQRSYMT